MTPVDPLRALIAGIVREEVAKALATAPANDEYLDPRAAALVASVSPRTIRRWVRVGLLEEYRAGRVCRVKRADLERLLRDGRRPVEELTPEAAALRDFG